MLAGREEQRVATQRIARFERDARELAVAVVDPRNRLGTNADAVLREPLAQPPAHPAAVRADDDVGAPGFQTERQSGGVGAQTHRREAPIAPFPAVAIRTMKDRAAVAVVEARDGRQIVDDAGRDEEIARLFFRAVGARDEIMPVDGPRANDADLAEFHAVRGQLAAPA